MENKTFMKNKTNKNMETKKEASLKDKTNESSESKKETSMETKTNTKQKTSLKDKAFSSHDRCFKQFFSRPELARELFHIIFSKEELGVYDLNKLKMEKDSWTNKKTEKKADLVFSVPFKDSPEIKLDVLILLEHKSSYDKNLFHQLLAYQILLRNHSLQQKGSVQPIVPVLFYHGKAPLKWKKSLQEEDFKSSYDRIPFKTRKSMLNYEIRVVDTKDPEIPKIYKERDFKGYGVIRLLSEIWDLKELSKDLIPSRLEAIYVEFEPYLKSLDEGERWDVWQGIFDYVSENTKMDLDMWEKTEDLLTKKRILKKGELMSLADTLRAEGMQKGIQKGRQEGRKEERQEVILNMLKEKADISFITKVTGLSEEEIKKLKNGS